MANTRTYTDFWQGAGIDRVRLTQSLARPEEAAKELQAVAKKLGAVANARLAIDPRNERHAPRMGTLGERGEMRSMADRIVARATFWVREDVPLGIDVDRDGLEPAQIWQGLAVLVDAPHSAVVLNDYVIDQVEVAKANNPQ